MRHSDGIAGGSVLVAAAAAMIIAVGCQETSIYALNLGEVAVVTGDFDTPEGALDKMEVGYTLFNGWHENGPLYEGYEPDYDWTGLAVDGETDVWNAENQVEFLLANDYVMGAYDLIFLSCGMRGAGAHIYNNAALPDDHLVAEPTVVANLRNFVELGGYVYATDWTYDLIEAAFPDAIDFLGEDTEVDAAQHGEPQTLNGRVVEAALQEHMGMESGGNEVEVIFRFDSFAVIEGVGSGTDILVEGDIVYQDGADLVTLGDSPLLVVFEYGDRGGKVIYTPLQTVAQITTDVQDIIDFLVLQLDRAES
jgi:hypothetical protein